MEILQSVAKQQRFSLTFIPLPQRILRLCPPNNSGAPTPLLGRWQFSDILSRRIPMRYIYKLDWLCLILCIAPLFLTAQNPTPGQNVNMVSGTKWPGGDPFLQRQNEPSIAGSLGNRLNLLAARNDYGTVNLNLVVSYLSILWRATPGWAFSNLLTEVSDGRAHCCRDSLKTNRHLERLHR